MTVYTVRFCGKEFIANNLRDFARIAVFAKWYLRTQALSEKLHCSVEQSSVQTEPTPINFFPSFKDFKDFDQNIEKPLALKNDPMRRSRVAVMRKALRAFFYTNF